MNRFVRFPSKREAYATDVQKDHGDLPING